MRSREQVLDELEHLATVAHAQCAGYLFIRCALGNGADPPAGAPAPPPAVTDAAAQARSMAVGEMRQLRRINTLLTQLKRPATVGRAAELHREPAPSVAIAPLTAAQLERVLDREHALAQAVDARYAGLQPSVDPAAAPVFEGDLAGQVGFILEVGTEHASRVTALRDSLAGLEESAYLRVTRDVPDDDLERGLRDLSDRYYGLIVAALAVSFAHDDLGSNMLDKALNAMFALDEVNSLLAVGGLLPAFTMAVVGEPV